jgi:tRNA (guanine-N7-)-methyltransferase
LINPDFVKKLKPKLKIGGYLHCATDWKDYAEQMLSVLNSESALANQHGEGGFVPRPTYRPLTKFEQRGTRLGHGVWDVIFNRIK